jgi:uncharacterized membrane protein
MGKLIRIILSTFCILAAGVAPAWAIPVGPVPEIDPSLAPCAIALLTGGLLILKSKFGRK